MSAVTTSTPVEQPKSPTLTDAYKEKSSGILKRVDEICKKAFKAPYNEAISSLNGIFRKVSEQIKVDDPLRAEALGKIKDTITKIKTLEQIRIGMLGVGIVIVVGVGILSRL